MERILKKIFVLAFLLFSFFPGFTDVPGESELLEADKLINESNYDEALRILIEYIKKYPSQFDGAQKRIRIITGRREQYNEKADELINLIVNEPENDREKLGLIRELESLEKNTNPSTKKFIEETKSASQFTFYRARFQDIFMSGREALIAGDYAGALDIYNSGFFFYKVEFNEEFPEQAEIIDSQLQRINLIIRDLKVLLLENEAALGDFIAFWKGKESGNQEKAFNNLKEGLKTLTLLRNEIAEYGWYMKNLFVSNNKDKTVVTEDSFLPFAYRMILGRETSAIYEGMTGVLDSNLASSLLVLTETFYSALDDNMELILADFEKENYDGAKEKILKSRRILDYVDETAGLAELRGKTPEGFFCAVGKEIPGTKISWDIDKRTVEYLKFIYQTCDEIIGLNETLKNISSAMSEKSPDFLQWQESFRNLLSGDSPGDWIDINKIRESISGMQELIKTASYLITRIPEINRDYIADLELKGTGVYFPELYNDEGVSLENPETGKSVHGKYTFEMRDYSRFPYEYGDSLEKYLGLVREETNGYLLKEGERLGGILESCFSLCYESDESELKRIAELGQGTPGEFNIVYRYPGEALEQLENFGAVLDTDRELLEKNKDYWDSLGLNGFSALAGINSTLEEAISGLSGLKQSLEEYRQVFSLNVRASEAALNEAKRRFGEAEKAMMDEDFTLARDRLQKSRDKYTEAFELQESVELRQSTDSALLNLGMEIAKRENDRVVKDVRNLIEEAKVSYYTGDFPGAEDILNRAKSRWSVTHIEENPEIEKWAGIVGTAMMVNSGRTIPVTAPLYPEMSQLLSLANQYYEQGHTEIQNGNREEGIDLLNEALDKIADVKMVYPLNQESNLLSLKINRLLDSDSFDKMFKRMFENAKRDYKITDKTGDCYNDLISLYEINPDYPGLKDLIYQVELYLGIRMPPVKESDKVKSRELTAEAEEIYNSKNTAMYPVALEQLDQALELWSDNSQAVALKDRIQISVGGSETVVLSSQDERIYKQAVAELQNGNTLLAASYVNRLMEKPENRKSSKVIALDERIKSLL